MKLWAIAAAPLLLWGQVLTAPVQEQFGVAGGVAAGPVIKAPYELVVVESRLTADSMLCRVKDIADLFRVIEVLKLETRGDGVDRWVWTGPPGRYLVEIITYTADGGLQFRELQVVIGGGLPIPPPPIPPPTPDPDPEPEPDPDIPADRFDNIGRRSAAWAPDDPENKAAVAAAYTEVCDGLAGGTVVDLEDANEQLEAATAGLPESWRTWRTNVGRDLNSRWSAFTRRDIIDYFRALAAGLGG